MVCYKANINSERPVRPSLTKDRRCGKPRGKFLFISALLLVSLPCCLLGEFTYFLSSEVIILPGSSVIFIMVSLPEPKYKNAGRLDDMFFKSRQGRGGLLMHRVWEHTCEKHR